MTRIQAESWARRHLIALLRRGHIADERGALVLGDLVVLPDGSYDWHDQAWELSASDRIAWDALGRCYAEWRKIFEAAREAGSVSAEGEGWPGTCPLCAGAGRAFRRPR